MHPTRDRIEFFLGRLLHRLTKKYWNRIVHRIILQTYDRRMIGSYTMHEILGEWNKVCWPEWHKE